jgi:hypothetical protein
MPPSANAVHLFRPTAEANVESQWVSHAAVVILPALKSAMGLDPLSLDAGMQMVMVISKLRTTPAIPWAVPLMALLRWLLWQYLIVNNWSSCMR